MSKVLIVYLVAGVALMVWLLVSSSYKMGWVEGRSVGDLEGFKAGYKACKK